MKINNYQKLIIVVSLTLIPVFLYGLNHLPKKDEAVKGEAVANRLTTATPTQPLTGTTTVTPNPTPAPTNKVATASTVNPSGISVTVTPFPSWTPIPTWTPFPTWAPFPTTAPTSTPMPTTTPTPAPTPIPFQPDPEIIAKLDELRQTLSAIQNTPVAINIIEGRKQRAYQDWMQNNFGIYMVISGSGYYSNILNSILRAYGL